MHILFSHLEVESRMHILYSQHILLVVPIGSKDCLVVVLLQLTTTSSGKLCTIVDPPLSCTTS